MPIDRRLPRTVLARLTAMLTDLRTLSGGAAGSLTRVPDAYDGLRYIDSDDGTTPTYLPIPSESRTTSLITTAITQAGTGITGTVATPTDLPGSVTNGRSYTVQSTQTIWTGVSGAWVDSGTVALIPGQPQTSGLYNRALSEMIMLTGGLSAGQAGVATGTLVVAIGGDSITEGWDQTDLYNDAYAYRFANDLQAALPGVGVTVANYALGGRSIWQLVDPNYKGLAAEPSDISTGFGPRPDSPVPRTWITPGLSYLGHLKALHPHVVIWATGQNDATADGDIREGLSLDALQTEIQTWTPVPSLILVTTLMNTSDQSRYAQPLARTRKVARATREWARIHGVYCADAGRLDRILREGLDDVSRASRMRWIDQYSLPNDWIGDTTPLGVSNRTFTPTGYFNILSKASVYGFAVTGELQFRSASEILQITGRENEGAVVFQMLQQSVEVYHQNDLGSPGTPTATAALSSPLTTWTAFRVEAKGARTRVWIGGSLVLDHSVVRALADGPVRLVAAGGSGAAPMMRQLQLLPSDPLRGAATYTEAQILGNLNSVDEQSGDGIHHPSGLGHAMVYTPTLAPVIRTLATRSAAAASPGPVPAALYRASTLSGVDGSTLTAWAGISGPSLDQVSGAPTLTTVSSKRAVHFPATAKAFSYTAAHSSGVYTLYGVANIVNAAGRSDLVIDGNGFDKGTGLITYGGNWTVVHPTHGLSTYSAVTAGRHVLAVSYDGSAFPRLWVDGVEQARVSGNADNNLFVPPTSMQLGSADSDSAFDLFEARIYASTLTPTQIVSDSQQLKINYGI